MMLQAYERLFYNSNIKREILRLACSFYQSCPLIKRRLCRKDNMFDSQELTSIRLHNTFLNGYRIFVATKTLIQQTNSYFFLTRI